MRSLAYLLTYLLSRGRIVWLSEAVVLGWLNALTAATLPAAAWKRRAARSRRTSESMRLTRLGKLALCFSLVRRST